MEAVIDGTRPERINWAIGDISDFALREHVKYLEPKMKLISKEGFRPQARNKRAIEKWVPSLKRGEINGSAFQTWRVYFSGSVQSAYSGHFRFDCFKKSSEIPTIARAGVSLYSKSKLERRGTPNAFPKVFRGLVRRTSRHTTASPPGSQPADYYEKLSWRDSSIFVVTHSGASRHGLPTLHPQTFKR